MKRRNVTPEQLAAAQDRRAAFVKVCQEVAAMTEGERQTLAKLAGIRTCEDHPLSPRNAVLIQRQRPGSSFVGGFRQWLKHGRVVRKGERGIKILVPQIGRLEAGEGVEVVGGALPEGGLDVLRGFRIGTVFDITQTHENPDSKPRAGDHGISPVIRRAVELVVAGVPKPNAMAQAAQEAES